MRNSLSALCASFIENRDVLKQTFSMENTYIYPVCAAIFTDRHRSADEERLKDCKELLKQSTGVFSNFRGTSKLAMISMLSLDANPERLLDNALELYSDMKKYFISSQYLPLVSMVLAQSVEPSRFCDVAERTRHIYELMKAEHPFLTSGEDSVFAALLALSGLTDEQVVSETEQCYRLLKEKFFSANSVQSLSHVLALGDGEAQAKCEKAIEIYEALKALGHRYGTGYELATLGGAVLLPADSKTVVDDIAQVDDFLSQQKGYGFFGAGKRQRIMHAGMIVASDYSKGGAIVDCAAVGATISLIAAQQAAMFAAIASSSAASSSSGS